MYPISSAVKALFDAESTQFLRITGVDRNGEPISITEANVMLDGFNIDRFSCNGEKLEIGTAIAAEMTLKLDNRQGQYNDVAFEGAELFVEIGIGSPVNWIPCGFFTPDEQPRSLSTITLHALDRMMKFDAVPPVMTPWTTQSGEVMTDSAGNPLYFLSNVRFPITVANLVKRVAILCGVPFDQSLSGFPNYNYTLSALPVLQQKITFRNLIQWCAGIMGTNAWIDWEGKLRFSWYGAATGYTLTTANRFSSDLHEDDIAVTGVQYTNTQGVSIVSGSADYALDMTGNYLAATGIAEILPNVKNAVNGFTYRPFTASVINAPYLWPMDMVTFTDKDGNNHVCALTNVNFGINGSTELQSKGETAQANSGVGPNGVTTEQARLIEQAYEVANNLDKSLDQEGVFNRLTNNGEAQGIYIIDGQVYVNMTYARSGTLVLGGLNNQNGLLQIRDANDNVIGVWDNTGIETKSLTAIEYVYVNGGTNSYIKIPLSDSSVWENNYVEFSKNGAVFSNSEYVMTISTDYVSGNFIHVRRHDDSQYNGFYVSGDAITGYSNNASFSLSPGTFQVGIANSTYLIYNSILGFRVDLPATFNSSLSVAGTKSRIVSTDQYADRLLYCYETPSPMFGDVGEGVVGEDGLCYISIDPVFAQTITTSQYQVFLQKYGKGEAWVKERRGAYFIVEGTPGMAFGWEIKAKQRDYDQRRLDPSEQPYTPPQQTYGADAAQYIEDMKKERIPA